MRLAGKTALIVGGTTGIGFAAARLMIAEGARVAICGQEAERLREASAALGEQAKAFRADLRNVLEIRGLAEDVGRWTDRLDILFLNAGISRPGEFNGVDEAFFEDHFAINVKGPFFLFQQMLGLLGSNASVVITTSCLDEMGRPDRQWHPCKDGCSRRRIGKIAGKDCERGPNAAPRCAVGDR